MEVSTKMNCSQIVEKNKTTMPNSLRIIPLINKSLIVTYPVPKTTALVGVATGNIKA